MEGREIMMTSFGRIKESFTESFVAIDVYVALLEGAQIKQSKEEFARGMVQREHNAVVRDAQTMP